MIHRSSDRNPPCLYLYRRVAPPQACAGGLPCNAWLPAHLHPQSRSCPDHPPEDSASKNPVPCAPSFHTQPSHHEGEIYLGPHPRYGRISYTPNWSEGPTPALHTIYAGGQVST